MKPESVYQAFLDAAAHYESRPFLHIPAVSARGYHEGAIDFTYGEAKQQVEGLKSRYGALGYGSGHRIAILLENRAAFFFHWIALNGLGISVVPVNGEMTVEEQVYILSNSDACAAVAVDEKLVDLQAAAALMDTPIPVVSEHELEQLPGPIVPAGRDGLDLSSECAMLFTSGSTRQTQGLPVK